MDMDIYILPVIMYSLDRLEIGVVGNALFSSIHTRILLHCESTLVNAAIDSMASVP